MEGTLRRPPRIARGAGHNDTIGTHTNEHRHLQYKGIDAAVLACRECEAPTIPTCGDMCPRCWRKLLTERAILRWSRLLEAGR